MTAVNSSNAAGAPAALLQSAGTLPARAPASDRATQAVASAVAAAAPARAAHVEETTRPTREAVEQAAHRIETFVKSVGRSMDFSIDNTTGRSILRVVDPQSGEVIRQLPPEETLRVAKAVEYMQSMLVHQRA